MNKTSLVYWTTCRNHSQRRRSVSCRRCFSRTWAVMSALLLIYYINGVLLMIWSKCHWLLSASANCQSVDISFYQVMFAHIQAAGSCFTCGICSWLTQHKNKKLRYREENSASVVLSWCTLWHNTKIIKTGSDCHILRITLYLMLPLDCVCGPPVVITLSCHVTGCAHTTDRIFTVAGPSVWNSLLVELQNPDISMAALDDDR